MKKRSILNVVLCLAVLAFMAGRADAAMVFSDGYEDDTIGNVPVISGSNIGDSYGVPLNTVLVAANPDSASGSGNESAQVLAGGGAATFANNIVALFTSAQSINGMTISYDFYNSAGSHDNDGVRVALVGDADNNRDVFIRNDRDGLIKLDGTDQTQSNYLDSVWQNWTATFTSTGTAGEYTLDYVLTNLATSDSISGSQVVAVNLDVFTGGKARGILLEGFEGNAGANDFTGYVDNVTVVPEPATMLLLGLGAVALRRRK